MTKEEARAIIDDIKMRLTGEMIIKRYSPGVDLAKARDGDNYVLRCFLPGHKDDTPSLSIGVNNFMYQCFGKCGVGSNKGDYLDIIKLCDNCDFWESLKIACEMTGLSFESYEGKKIAPKISSVPAESVINVGPKKPPLPNDIVDEFHQRLLEREDKFLELISERKLEADVILEFKVGLDSYGNYTIPVYENDKLVNIKYRNAKPKPAGPSRWIKYWSHSIVDKDGYKHRYGEKRLYCGDIIRKNEYNKGDKLIICGGEFDALVLNNYRSKGIIGVTSTTGEGSWDEEWNSVLADFAGEVYVCFDNDEAGEEALEKLYSKSGESFKFFVIDIGAKDDSVGDITEFFCKYNVDDFIKLLDAAKHNGLYETNAPIVLDSRINQESWAKDVMSICDGEPVGINPAMYIHENGDVYITAMFERKHKKEHEYANEDGETRIYEEEVTTHEPMIVSSRRGLWPIPRIPNDTRKEYPFAVAKFLDWTVKQEPLRAQTNWTGLRVKEFLTTGNLFNDVKKAYNDIYFSVKKYSCFIRKTHCGLVALYIFASFFYEAFSSFPYMLLNGEKGSGKSTVGKVIATMSFNGEFVTNPSVAALARGIEEMKGTMVLDEAENQSKREQGRSDLGQVLNSGYQKGAKRIICDKDKGNKRQEFDVYCPKVFASIYGLNDVTQSRCITVIMRKLDAGQFKNMGDSSTDRMLNNANKQMYEIMMGYAGEVIKAYKEVKKMTGFTTIDKSLKLDVVGREREIYTPLLSVALMIYNTTGFSRPWDNLIEELKTISEEKGEESLEEPEQILMQSIIDVLDKDKVNEREFNMHELVENYKAAYVEDPGIKCEKWIAKTIRRHGWAERVYDGKLSKRVRVKIKTIKNGYSTESERKVYAFYMTRKSLKTSNYVDSEVSIPF